MAKLKDQPTLSVQDFLTMLIPVVPDDEVTDVWNKLTYELIEIAFLMHSKQLGNRIITRRLSASASTPDDPSGGEIEDGILSDPPENWTLGVAPITTSLGVDLWICQYDVDPIANTINYSDPYKWPGENRKIVGGTGISVAHSDGEIIISLT